MQTYQNTTCIYTLTDSELEKFQPRGVAATITPLGGIIPPIGGICRNNKTYYKTYSSNRKNYSTYRGVIVAFTPQGWNFSSFKL